MPFASSIVNRRAKYEAICLFRFGNNFVHHVISKDTLAFSGTTVAANAVPDRYSRFCECFHLAIKLSYKNIP